MTTILKRSFLLFSIFMFIHPAVIPAQSTDTGTRDACLKTARMAIEMELEEYGQKLKTAERGTGPAGNAEKFKNRIKELKGQLKEIAEMNPEDYSLSSSENKQDIDFENTGVFGPVIPAEKIKVVIQADQESKKGVILNVEGMTRSGPFYHVAGIVDDDYSRIKLNHRYELTIYLVYKREYFGFIPDYYVYIAKVRVLEDTAKGN